MSWTVLSVAEYRKQVFISPMYGQKSATLFIKKYIIGDENPKQIIL
jgi:hypothetical protein